MKAPNQKREEDGIFIAAVGSPLAQLVLPRTGGYHMGTFLCAMCLKYPEADVMPLVMNAAAACRHLMARDMRKGYSPPLAHLHSRPKLSYSTATFSVNSSTFVDLATASRRLRVIAIGYFSSAKR